MIALAEPGAAQQEATLQSRTDANLNRVSNEVHKGSQKNRRHQRTRELPVFIPGPRKILQAPLERRRRELQWE